jgi:anti-sigma factor RsiW
MSEAITPDCGDVRELIPDLVAGRLPAADAARVHGHVKTCADCRAELDLVRLLHATRAEVPAGLLDRITRQTARRRPARTWWGISAAAIAALALGIGIVSDDASAPGSDVPAFVREAEEGEIWLSDDGLVAGAPALDDLSDEALLELLDELTNVSTGGGA